MSLARKMGKRTKYEVQPTITELYQRDRRSAVTGDERRHIWRAYALALVETFAERPLTSIAIDVRRAASDIELPVRYKRYWTRIEDTELRELWLALERARHGSSVDE